MTHPRRGHGLRHRLTLLTFLLPLVAACVLGIGSAVASADPPPKPLQTLSITGGNGTAGTVDTSTDWSQDPVAWDAGISTTGAWHFTGNPSPVWHPAYLAGAHPWGFVPGTNNWINCGPSIASSECGNSAGTVIAFRARFSLPVGSSNPNIKFWINSDNAGTYYVNGVQVTDRLVGGGGAGASPVPASTLGVPGVRTSALQSALQPGANEMFVVVEDWGGAAGFNYRADITVNADSPPVVIPPTSSDTTPPVINPTVTGTLGSNGWYTSDINVSWTVTDAQSTVTSQTGCSPTTVSSDTASITFTCTATSTGGTATQSVTLKRDSTAPTITGSRTPAANAAGWNNTSVTVSFSCADAGGSGIATSSVLGATLTGNGANQSVTNTGSCQDNAGNTAAAATVSGISIDKTAPVITASASPGPNANGWNNTNVTVSYICTDGGSGVDAAASNFADDLLSTSGTATGSCVDRAGNSASDSYAALIDKVKPLLAPVVSPNPVAIYGVAVASANATDALSGVDTFGCAAVDTSTIGPGTVSCTATDKAGNTQTASASYLVTVMASKQAVLDAINAELATASKRDRSELREAAKKLSESLDPRNWVDGNHLQAKRGARVFEDEKEAVQKLRQLLKDKKSDVADASLQSWIDTLVTIDRALAQIAIDEATAAGGNDKRVAEANKEMARADDRLAKGRPTGAIEHYKHAWQKLQKNSERDGHENDDHDN